MLNREEIGDLVFSTLSNYLGTQGASLKADSLLQEEFGLDSTEMVCIAVDLEKGLGFSMKEIKFGYLNTPDDVVNAIINMMPENELNLITATGA